MEKSITAQIIDIRYQLKSLRNAEYQYSSDRAYNNLKITINKLLTHADKLKTQKGKDKIYRQIEIQKQFFKDSHFKFDYDAYCEKLKSIEEDIIRLNAQLMELEKMQHECKSTYTPTTLPLCDKVWNRRSNR